MSEKDMIMFIMIIIYRLSVILGFISLAMYFKHWWLVLLAILFMGEYKWNTNSEDDKNG